MTESKQTWFVDGERCEYCVHMAGLNPHVSCRGECTHKGEDVFWNDHCDAFAMKSCYILKTDNMRVR